jgi:hypothetical protein
VHTVHCAPVAPGIAWHLWNIIAPHIYIVYNISSDTYHVTYMSCGGNLEANGITLLRTRDIFQQYDTSSSLSNSEMAVQNAMHITWSDMFHYRPCVPRSRSFAAIAQVAVRSPARRDTAAMQQLACMLWISLWTP